MRKVLGIVTRSELPTGPLAGTLVLDFGQTAVGPVSTMFLGYLGATVIKVELPRGEIGRFDVSRKRGAGFTFLSTNLGKYSVTLDLKDPGDYSYALALIARADVLVDNFRSPDVMRRLRLDYFDVLKPVNPALVYLQSSSFQGRGPLQALTSFEWVAQALSGFAGATGSVAGGPEFSRGTAHLDWTGAMINTVAVLAGLHLRGATGEGSMLSTSQFGSSVFAGASRLAAIIAAPDAPPRLGHDFGQEMLDRAFVTADGFLAICAPTQAIWRRLMGAVGLPPETPVDPTGGELEPLLESRPTGEWLSLLRPARIPSASAPSASTLVAGLKREPQVRAQALIEDRDPGRGGVLYAAPPWEIMDVTPAPMRPAPELGEHDELVKCVIGPAPAPAPARPSARRSAPDGHGCALTPLSQSRPLAGRSVIEVGTGLAVGTAGAVLAELGAAVIKVLPPWGDTAVAPAGAVEMVEEQLHADKSVERLDLQELDGKHRLDGLLRHAAAVIVSGPLRFREKFGLDESAVRLVQQDIVYCGLTGFGCTGPLADAPATEFDVELMSGMTRQLGRAGEPPVRQGFHLVSVNTGYAAAQAVVAGLLATREGPGSGRHYEVSLLRTAVALNAWNITAESGADDVEGKQVQAWAWPPDHGYACKDRQVLISIKNNDEGWVKFLVALDRHDLLRDERFNTLEHLRANEWQLPGLIGENTGQMTSEELRLLVEDVGGQVVPVLDPTEVLGHPQVSVQQLVCAGGRRIRLPIDMVSL
jgi:crotonobetainyl-CoA:carnitine CoA-transferase CaiB-like acyl-CoA transferase